MPRPLFPQPLPKTCPYPPSTHCGIGQPPYPLAPSRAASAAPSRPLTLPPQCRLPPAISPPLADSRCVSRPNQLLSLVRAHLRRCPRSHLYYYPGSWRFGAVVFSPGTFTPGFLSYPRGLRPLQPHFSPRLAARRFPPHHHLRPAGRSPSLPPSAFNSAHLLPLCALPSPGPKLTPRPAP